MKKAIPNTIPTKLIAMARLRAKTKRKASSKAMTLKTARDILLTEFYQRTFYALAFPKEMRGARDYAFVFLQAIENFHLG